MLFHWVRISALIASVLVIGGARVSGESAGENAETDHKVSDEAVDGFSPVSYRADIQPLLTNYCFACHGTDEESRAAGLRLDDREAALEFGAIVPESAEDSEMVFRILSDDPELVMPPPETKKSLSESERQMLIRWIDEGAVYQKHWSLDRPKQVDLPQVSEPDWVQNSIDAFVLARLDAAGLKPAEPAEPSRLFRRLHLDVTGLPPEPVDVAAFLSDHAIDPHAAISKWVERLMETPAWGEHRARYWLDAARYADTHGMHFDNYREMWPYRDWVIRSFNRNQAFDSFIVEQLAGDLLPDPTTDQLIATGFNRCNMTTNEGGTIDEENLMVYAADRVQTFGWVFMGLTTNCAQCHDHKFDDFSAKDYYSLAAFFRNIDAPAKDGNSKDGRGPTLVLPSENDRSRWDALPGEIAAAKSKLAAYIKSDAVNQLVTDWVDATSPDDVLAPLDPQLSQLTIPLSLDHRQLVIGRAADEVALTANGPLQFVSDAKPPFPSALKIGPSQPRGLPGTIELGNTGDFSVDKPFSVSAWIAPDAINGGRTIIAKMDASQKHRGWDFQVRDGKLNAHLIDQFPSVCIRVETPRPMIKANRWSHVAVTYDGSGKGEGVQFFLNGVRQPTKVTHNSLRRGDDTSEPSNLVAATPLKIGQRSRGETFDGHIRMVQIHDQVLPATSWMLAAKSGEVRSALQAQSRTPAQEKTLRDFVLNQEPTYLEQTEHRDQLIAEQTRIRERSPITHIQREKDRPAMANILMRGAYDQPGEEVVANTPHAMHPMASDAPRNRLGLAQWVIDPQNPLTARVTVNRFWQEVFGRGLVETVEDFGVTGMLPSHPELLDYLAVQFQESKWDVKAFFKQIFTSATYQQSAKVTPLKTRLDRDNRLLSRGPRFRMDAEMIRDAALASGDLLTKKMFGPGVKPYQPINIWEIVGLPNGNTRKYERDSGAALFRRSIYTFWKRMAPPPNLETFGAPNREVCTVRRERTNTPLQALVMLNDEQFVEAARGLATAAIRAAGDADATDAVLDWIAARQLSRNWTAAERSILDESHQAYLSHFQQHPEAADDLLDVGVTSATSSVSPAALAAWTMVCNQTMNLDETLTK